MKKKKCLFAPVVAVIMAVSACASSWSEQDVAALLEANESALQKLVEEFAQEPRIHAVFGVRDRYVIRGVELPPGPGSLGVEIRRGPGSKWTVTKENWTSKRRIPRTPAPTCSEQPHAESVSPKRSTNAS